MMEAVFHKAFVIVPDNQRWTHVPTAVGPSNTDWLTSLYRGIHPSFDIRLLDDGDKIRCINGGQTPYNYSFAASFATRCVSSMGRA